MMKNKKNLSEDEFRQKVDGFSMKNTDESSAETGYKIVNEPLYQTHSANYDKIKSNKQS
jgi:hypothetical protein